ncbi:MAG: hypothetical protein PHR35_05300, partial [Kiritimatiellae bacterium]|nr:hypothetical protein [Kiritimatiellia bacterium]
HRDYGILQEFVWDRLMEHNTHSLAAFSWSGNGNAIFSEPAIFRYVHSRFPLFAGTSLWPMVADLFGGAIPKPTIPDYFAFLYSYGAYLSHWGADACLAEDYPPELLTPENKDLINIFSLRHAVHRDLNNDDFRDTLGLGTLPARVFARVFVRPDRSAALLTLVDTREQRDAFTLTLDLKAHGLGRATGAEIVRGKVVSPLAVPAMMGLVAEVAVPANAGKAVAVRILTNAER